VGPPLCPAVVWAAWIIRPNLNRNDEGPGFLPGLLLAFRRLVSGRETAVINKQAWSAARLTNMCNIGTRNACDWHVRYIAMAMPILSIEHVTSYRYHRPVAFGEHRMMLRPRDDDDQRLLQSELGIAPKPRELAWERDKLGNYVAIAHFADRSDELCFVSTVRLEHAPNGFHEGDIEDYARVYPFSYTAGDWLRLRRFIFDDVAAAGSESLERPIL
jgi:hypothetical protein